MRLRRFRLPAGVLAFIVGMVVSAGQASAATCPWMTAGQSTAKRTSELLAAMSLADKIQMVTGTGEFNPTSAPASTSRVTRWAVATSSTWARIHTWRANRQRR